MNLAVVMGRLVKDVETRYSKDGMCISRYTLAVDRRGRDKDGETKTDFLRVVAFGKGGEFAEKYFRKGLRVLVSGQIQTDTYTDKEGRKLTSWEIAAHNQEFADGKGDNAGGAPAQQKKAASGQWMDIPENAEDEGLPFN